MKQSEADAIWDAIKLLLESAHFDAAKNLFDVAVNATPTPVFDPHAQYPRGGQIIPADKTIYTVNDKQIGDKSHSYPSDFSGDGLG
jgi:hypothetical protein